LVWFVGEELKCEKFMIFFLSMIFVLFYLVQGAENMARGARQYARYVCVTMKHWDNETVRQDRVSKSPTLCVVPSSVALSFSLLLYASFSSSVALSFLFQSSIGSPE